MIATVTVVNALTWLTGARYRVPGTPGCRNRNAGALARAQERIFCACAVRYVSTTRRVVYTAANACYLFSAVYLPEMTVSVHQCRQYSPRRPKSRLDVPDSHAGGGLAWRLGSVACVSTIQLAAGSVCL